ncbi:MAG: flavin-dependent oxidoreductase [Rhodobacteraceae bacterium]|nr:flavin-dependent oxidoreductase [Paracoccaceae bacterium]MBR26728.1 flavin-dependent oxidoreductase [Paracoccaceae bacterium]MBR29511.1 flavin-dependent oxidoreductase [Paracoccaceae bacterium]
MTVLIAGAGIAGLTLALTCHQIGLRARVFEAARELRPLGVGINLQPNAVRELEALGLGPDLARIGVETRDWGLHSKTGREIWTEPRGRAAGYRWPQFSVHRGALQMALLREVRARLGEHAVTSGARAAGFATQGEEAVLRLDDGGEARGGALVAADGLHSAIRAAMHPGEGRPIWSGAVLWRGATRAKPFLSGASMALVGTMAQRFVAYPISAPDPDTGEALINWIAELKFDPSGGWTRSDWNRRAEASEFLPRFEGWRFGWIDAPALIRATDEIFEYPMVDRDPAPFWTVGRTTLIGDAAHVMYPVGSNGASQAVMDARALGRAFLDHGVGPAALAAYEAQQRPATSRMILATRGSGPDALLGVVEDRCGGDFERIEDVIPRAEMDAFQARWKGIAGLAREALNDAPPIIPEGTLAPAG